MEVGNEIGQYVIIEHIGRGGMADVWSALDERLQRTVAVKTIAANLTDERMRLNFEQEARTIASLEHSNILPIYDFGEYERQLYLVMRYISGGSLLDHLIEGPLADDDAVRIGEAVASALERAHADLVVHRDLKPANILLDNFRTPYLADFGLAITAGTGGEENISSGTLLYMPPEQVMGGVVDSRADIYAFAIMLFQMITGEFPFEAQAALCLRQIQEGDELPDPRKYRPDLPENIVAVLRVATALDVEARYESAGLLMGEVKAALLGGSAYIAPQTGDAASLIGPAQEPVPYRADTELRPGDDLMMHTMEADSPAAFARFVASSDLDSDDVDALVQGQRFDSEDMAAGFRDKLMATISADSEVVLADLEEAMATMDVNSQALFEQLISRQRGPEPSGPLEPELSTVDEDVSEALPADVDEPPAVREARNLFHKMARAWSHGQRFLTGATHFANIHAHYATPEVYNLELTDVGRVAMLRGAIEHNYELEYWLEQIPGLDTRRELCLYALRSDSAAARALAVRLLKELPDTDPPSVAVSVGRLLHSETDQDVRRTVVELLAGWGERATEWQEFAYTVDTDLLLAEQALRDDTPDIAETAARAIGRLRSLKAIEYIAAQESSAPGRPAVQNALAWVRDEADDLPPSVTVFQQRARAFGQLTWHYLSTNMSRMGLRFFTALLGTGIGMGLLVHFIDRMEYLTILRLDHLYKVIGNGQTFGLIAGLGVMLAAVLPLRLAGSAAQREEGATLWRWWGRLLVGLVIGGLIATIAYLNFQVVSLRLPDPELPILLLAGGSMALGCAVASTFRWRLWARLLLVFVTTLVPIPVAWHLYFYTQEIYTPIFYFDTYEGLGSQLWTTSIALALFTALGAYGPELLDEVRAMTGWPSERKRILAYGSVILGVVSLFAGFVPLLGLIVSVAGLFFGAVSREHGHDQRQPVIPPYRQWVYIGSALSMIGFWWTIFNALAGPFLR